MFIFTLVQFILSLITYSSCDNGTNTPIITVCNITEAAYIVPTIIQLTANVLGTIFAILYIRELKYGGGSSSSSGGKK